MGIAELKEEWGQRESLSAERDETMKLRDAALPELGGIVDRFRSGKTRVGDFRHEMDVFSRKAPHWGFGGTSGQMFLNMLVNAADEESLSEALRRALPAPANEQECRQKFKDFLLLVGEARERAAVGCTRGRLRDHDLGLDVGLRERTGYDVLLWLEAEVAEGRVRLPAIVKVHSGNVGAIKRMEQAIESIRRLGESQ